MTLLYLRCTFFGCGEWCNFYWGDWVFSPESQLSYNSFPIMTFLRRTGSLAAVWIKSLTTAAWCYFCSGSRSHRMKFAKTHFMPRSCVKISDTVVFGIPRSTSTCSTVIHWSLFIAAHTHSTFSGVLLVAGLPEHRSLSTESWPSLKHLCHTFICAGLTAWPWKPSESSK